ncbi:MAG TPA: thiamine phosphate synthase [Pyrinomonadaceae bacterium]
MKHTLPNLYPITDTELSGLTHFEQVRRLIEGGASLIQLRDKTSPTGAFYVAAAESVAYAHERGAQIIINDRVDVALASGADGVHLGQDDLDPVHARRLLGDGKIIGYSTHSVAQAQAAIELPVDYLAIGPVFTTSTKPEHEPVVGLEGVRAVRTVLGEMPLVAIGGITPRTAGLAFRAGADTVAVISQLISEPDKIAVRMREFIDIRA